MSRRKAKRPSPKQEAIAAYRDRFRRWTMAALPDMPADQWERLKAWVIAFGNEPESVNATFKATLDEDLEYADVVRRIKRGELQDL